MVVELNTQCLITEILPDSVTLSNVISSETSRHQAGVVVLVSDRIPNDDLYYSLKSALEEDRLDSLRVIGDAEAPNIIAEAVFSGHLAVREFGEAHTDEVPFRMEYVQN
jgi:dimethylamine/trimethylamine dehydrogenase